MRLNLFGGGQSGLPEVILNGAHINQPGILCGSAVETGTWVRYGTISDQFRSRLRQKV